MDVVEPLMGFVGLQISRDPIFMTKFMRLGRSQIIKDVCPSPSVILSFFSSFPCVFVPLNSSFFSVISKLQMRNTSTPNIPLANSGPKSSVYTSSPLFPSSAATQSAPSRSGTSSANSKRPTAGDSTANGARGRTPPTPNSVSDTPRRTGKRKRS